MKRTASSIDCLKRRRTGVLSVVLIALAVAVSPNPAFAAEQDAELDAAKRAAESVNAFALDLYKLAAKDSDESIVISPYSIYSAMGMLELGAGGNAKAEIDRALYFGDGHQLSLKALKDQISNVFPDGGPSKLYVSNAVWPDRRFVIKDSYAKNIMEFYDSDIFTVDYGKPWEAVAAINRWAEEKTENKIRNLLDERSVGKGTLMTLTSAAYFKSDWLLKFQAKDTKEEIFRGGAKNKVKMMRQENPFRYADTADCQIIKMPYSKSMSMYVLLPHDIDGLKKVEESLSHQGLADTLASVSHGRASRVILSLPKFDFDSGISLTPYLRSLNVGSIFTFDKNNFPSMSDTALAVTDVFHKAVITLDEEGTEAAAVTVINMGLIATRLEIDKIIFNADHPFLFLIREEVSGAILFLGRFMN